MVDLQELPELLFLQEYRKCYILEDTIYDIEKIPIIDSTKYQIYYYYPLFITEYQQDQQDQQYYIILEYDISQDILDRYARMKLSLERHIQLPTDIIELVCNQLFGYRNLEFLDGIDSSNHSNILIKKYILDNKCMFAFPDTFKLVKNNAILSKIHRYYSNYGYLDNLT